MTPHVRHDVQGILGELAHAARGRGAQQLNAAVAYLNPALAQTAALGREVAGDRAALATLVRSGAATAGALARQRAALGDGIDHAAAVLGTLADRRAQLGDLLVRAPGTARAAERTLRGVDALLPRADAVLRASRPALSPLTRLLHETAPLAAHAAPAVAQLRTLLAQSKAALHPLPALDAAASPAVGANAKALGDVLPIVTGLRVYAPDVIGGFFDGFGGSTGGYYDANGHYLRISLQGSSASLPGLLPAFPENPLPLLGGFRTGLDARCPGGAEEPGPDGSNPWIPAEPKDICDPKDDHR
jgi:phospholipid/cholesterol/gamma-HCH transport system substrate-binding protein